MPRICGCFYEPLSSVNFIFDAGWLQEETLVLNVNYMVSTNISLKLTKQNCYGQIFLNHCTLESRFQNPTQAQIRLSKKDDLEETWEWNIYNTVHLLHPPIGANVGGVAIAGWSRCTLSFTTIFVISLLQQFVNSWITGKKIFLLRCSVSIAWNWSCQCGFCCFLL